MEPYTVAVTSCGRFDLLERTLGSLLPRLEGPVAKLVITEDSGDPAVHDVIRRFSGGGLKFEVLVNERPLGLIRSIDRLYSRNGSSIARTTGSSSPTASSGPPSPS